MKIERDFEDLLRLFSKNKVRYCIIGAFAVAFYGRPQYTKDIDILIDPLEANAKKIVKALNDFGFGSLKLSADDFCKKGNIIQLGYEPVRVDILTSIKGLSFDRVWKNRIKGTYGKQRVNFISLDDLIKCKKISARNKDLADLEILQLAKRKRK
ncbi:nucleotidyltransferase [Candidatus Auribacterota bacterium]